MWVALLLSFLGAQAQTIAPATVTQILVNDGAAQRSTVTTLTVEFSRDVVASLRKEHLILRNITNNQDIDPVWFSFIYTPATRRAVWKFPYFVANQRV